MLIFFLTYFLFKKNIFIVEPVNTFPVFDKLKYEVKQSLHHLMDESFKKKCYFLKEIK